MGQEESAARTSVTESDNPEQIREEIKSTRQELGDTVEALAAKTDVKAQAKRKVEETKATVTDKKDELLGRAKEASPESARTAAVGASEKARQNPLPLAAAGAFLFGFLAGRSSKK
jgi:transcriptional regulator with XRE-family HTH domain